MESLESMTAGWIGPPMCGVTRAGTVVDMGEALENPLVLLIVACEVGFWVLLGAGLLARYLLRLRRTSNALLLATPVVDVVLLVVAVLDLARGGEATTAHALGAVYLGFSVAFGHSVIRWADQRVAHRFAGGPPPWTPPKSGPGKVAHEWREWGKCLLGCSIAAAVLAVLAFVVGEPSETGVLWREWLPRLGTITAIWFTVGPLWTSLRAVGSSRSSRGG